MILILSAFHLSHRWSWNSRPSTDIRPLRPLQPHLQDSKDLSLCNASPFFNPIQSVEIVPVFFFALPLLTIWEFRNVKRRRQKHSFEHIAIKTTGEEGIENYKKVIYDQW